MRALGLPYEQVAAVGLAPGALAGVRLDARDLGVGAVAIRGAAERGDADVAEHEAVAAAAIADPPV
jgi:hypothetical protein